MTDTSRPELSIVVTIYNAEKMINRLVERIIATTNEMHISYEIVMVDDGSRDNSAFMMEELSRANKAIKSVVLSRNFGQQIAMSAGIHYAKGNYVLIMDGDLQNPPEAIPTFYNAAKSGYDIVYASASSRNNLIDRSTSWLFWLFLKSIMKVNIVRNQLMMRMLNRRVANYFCDYPEKVRTIAAITHDIGMKYTVLHIDNNKRLFGKSNYSTLKRLDLAIDVLLDLSNHPLSMVFYLGLTTLCLTSVGFIYYLHSYMTANVLPGFTSLVLIVMFFGSLNLISLGIIARYVSNVYSEVKHRPLFLTRKTVNTDEINIRIKPQTGMN